MKEAEFEIDDVEREGGDEAHLTNNTVRFLSWDIEKVEVGRRLFAEANTRNLISNINGAAMAGMTLFSNSYEKVSYFVQEN